MRRIWRAGGIASVAATALLCLFPGLALGGTITATTNLGGSCKLVSSVARSGPTMDYQVRVASSTCQVATKVRQVASVGLLYDVDDGDQRVDDAPWTGSGLPYSNAGNYTEMNPMHTTDDFRSRFDVSVLLRCARRPAGPTPPLGTTRACANNRREQWIDPTPGNRCRVASEYRASDKLICRFLDPIPF